MTIASIADIRARCIVDRCGCWRWQGAIGRSGPVVWTFDDRVGRKVSMGGARAVWQFLNQTQMPVDKRAYRTCFEFDCLAPSHVAAADMATIGRVLSRAGIRKGTNVEQRRASLVKARAAQGKTDTPSAVVLAIRQLPASVSHAAAGREFGLSRDAASSIRRGKTRSAVWKEAA